MQNFTEIPSNEKMKDSRSSINDNFTSVQSNFSGTSFPTVGIEVGQSCYRTDLGQRYELKGINPDVWVISFDADKSYVTQEYVDEQLLLKANLAGDVFTGNVEVPTQLKGSSSKRIANMEALQVGLADKLDIVTAQENYALKNEVPHTKVDNAVLADKATKWEAARSLNITGAVTGGGVIDGTEDITINLVGSQATVGDLATIAPVQNSREIYTSALSNPDAIDSSNSPPTLTNTQWLVTKYFLNTVPTIAEGSFSLISLLQNIAKNSHHHDVRREYSVGQCNCNCDCTCSDPS